LLKQFTMNNDQAHLTTEQRVVAIQRLTALWAFSESGLGGIMHALQIPFTGLVVGGMSVIMISFIAQISEGHYKEILKSALIVLIIKAMVSPYTPFPAYVAVSFQALSGFAIFRLLRVNFGSVLLLSIIAMIESAIQQLLILTLFFGQSIWKASDAFIAFVFKQFGIAAGNGSQWIIGIYLLIYILGGIAVAWIGWKTLKNFSSEKFSEERSKEISRISLHPINIHNKKNITRKLWVILSILVVLSVVMFFVAANATQGWIAVVRTVSWTMAAIMLWYMLINPLFIKLIKGVLQKKESRYSEEIARTLSFLPVLRQLTALAWQKSSLHKGGKRWYSFLSELIHSSLTYNEDPGKSATAASFKKTA